MRELRSCLVDCSPGMLRAVAEARGIRLTTSRQIDMVRELASALLQLDSVQDALGLLTPMEREALSALLSAGGRMPAGLFQQRYGQIRVLGDARLVREKPWAGPHPPAEGVWYLGLVFRAFARSGSRFDEFIFVPTDLRPLLPSATRDVWKPAFPEVAAPRASVAGDDSMALDLCELLIRAQNTRIRVLRGHRLQAADAEALTQRSAYQPLDPAAVADEATGRIALLLRLARRLRLLQTVEGAHIVNSPVARGWLMAPRHRQAESLWKAWRGDPGWDDLRAVPGLAFEEAGPDNDPLAARRSLLNLAAGCQPGRWYDADDVVGVIKAHAPDFQRTGIQYESWQISDSSGKSLTGLGAWDLVEGALIRYVICGPLHWLGAVSCGRHDRTPGRLAFSLTPAGGSWLLLRGSPLMAPPAPLRVDHDGVITCPQQVSLYDRFQVARFADWEAGAATQTYRLTPAALARGAAQGLKVEAVLAFLERASSRVPAKVRQSLQNWANRRGRVGYRHQFVLTVNAADDLAEIRAIPGVAELLGEQLSETSIAVDPSAWPELSKRLAELGYL